MNKIESKIFEFTVFEIFSKLQIRVIKNEENKIDEVKIIKIREDGRYLPFVTISQENFFDEIEEMEFVVNNWQTYEELLDFVIQDGTFFIDTGKRVASKYGTSPIWKICF